MAMFELSRNNRDQPDDVLLTDLREVSARLGGQVLTREIYSKHGRFAPTTVANRFGGWGRALGRRLECSLNLGHKVTRL
jgi:hypothetical protein